MIYTIDYSSPMGKMLIAAGDGGIRGLWFYGAKHFAESLPDEREEKLTPCMELAAKWLDDYFAGANPGFTPPLDPVGTPFQLAVWHELLNIPYGETTTYGAIASALGSRNARAVGAAVGRNPISLIVPCHRVLGADGSLTGYAGGLDRKRALLKLEQG